MDTFVVQLWVSPDETSCGSDLRGVVRHVATGVETAFRGDDEVLRLLHVARPPRAGTSRENLKERSVLGTKQNVFG